MPSDVMNLNKNEDAKRGLVLKERKKEGRKERACM